MAIPRVRREYEPIGVADKDHSDASMAYFLYTATTDPEYRKRISRRVLAILDHQKAFGFMMDDAKEKIAQLQQKKTAARLQY